MSQFYSNLVCEAGYSQPAVVAEKGQGMSTLTHGLWSGLLSTRRLRRKVRV